MHHEGLIKTKGQEGCELTVRYGWHDAAGQSTDQHHGDMRYSPSYTVQGEHGHKVTRRLQRSRQKEVQVRVSRQIRNPK